MFRFSLNSEISEKLPTFPNLTYSITDEAEKKKIKQSSHAI